MARHITTGQVKRLLEIDSEGLGIGEEVQELILRVTSGGVAKLADDLRIIQAKRYWDMRVGLVLGRKSFKYYLADIPIIPDALRAGDQRFPYLVLVEPRIGLAMLCQFGNVIFDGNDHTLMPLDECHADASQPIWIRIQDGRKNRNRRPSDCRQAFAKDEFGLTALQGICAYLQDPAVVTDLNKDSGGHAMDLVGSVYRGSHVGSACLWVENGQARLNWSMNGFANTRYGSASRRECEAL